jgi:alkanesulfonate monooxygenase SsuD/methylene tetrahydromethanopterin reductase-like flavin-dependent oxidoreductase (luciferase family)
LKVYREEFTPSTSLTQPYAMICINVVAADSERDARFLFTSMQQQFINLRRGRPGPLPAPVEDIESLWSAGEQYGVEQALRMSVVGDRDQVRTGLQKVISDTGIDELMINGQIFDHQARLHSFELAISVREDLIF